MLEANEEREKKALESNSHFLDNVKVMAHPLAGANVDRGVEVEIR